VKVDGLVIAARDRLPGNDLARWMVEIRGLGVDLACALLGYARPDVMENTSQALIAGGIDPAVADGLVPDLDPEMGYAGLWRRTESIRAAALSLPEERFEGIPDVSQFGPNHAEEIGPVHGVLFGPEFVTLDEATVQMPDVEAALDESMGALCRRHALEDGLRALKKIGWFETEETGLAERILLHDGLGVLVVCSQATDLNSLQDTLDLLSELGEPLLEVLVEQGLHPVTVAYLESDAGHLCWNLDGQRQRREASLHRCIPEAPAPAPGMMKSFVGHLFAAFESIPVPRWVSCPHCGSPRVDAGRLELERGRSRFITDLRRGAFTSSNHRHLRLVSRENDRSTVLLRVLTCPDCHVVRAFPGERPIPGASVPKRMGGEPLPPGLKQLLAEQTGRSDPLPEMAVPTSVDRWLSGQEAGTSCQYQDARLVYRAAFRLPDGLTDLSRSLRAKGSSQVGWHDAVGRVGRGQGTVLSWEISAADPSQQAYQIVLLGIDPEWTKDRAEAWFGPVDIWEPFTRHTCWRGGLVGTQGAVELVVIQDFLGAPGPYAGDGSDFEILDEVLGRAAVVIYAGDGNTAWDDEGVEWAADAGNLAVVFAPAPQLELVQEGREVPLLDAAQGGAMDAFYAHVDAAMNPQALLIVRRIREAVSTVEGEFDGAEMDALFFSSLLRQRATEAHLSESATSWLGLLDGVLTVLEGEGGADHHSGLRPSVSARRLAELGLPAVAVEGLWSILEFNERTGFGASITRWLQPILGETPDRLHLARVRAVCARIPDIGVRYQQLHELSGDVARGRTPALRQAVLTFWWGLAAPTAWPCVPAGLPDLLSGAPSGIRGKPVVFVGGGDLRHGVRFAQLLAGVTAPILEEIPVPGLAISAIVIARQSLSLHRLQQRAEAGNLTVVVSESPAQHWAGSLHPDAVGYVELGGDLVSECPDEISLGHHLPELQLADRIELASIMHTVHVGAGESVIEAGVMVGSLAWIREGFVAIDGEGSLGPGGLLGAEWFLDRQVSTRDVIATTSLSLDVLSLSGLDALADVSHASYGVIALAVARQLAHMVSRVGAPSGSGAERVAPQKLVADWRLIWPLVQQFGFHRVELEAVLHLFPEALAAGYRAGEVVASPGQPGPDLFVLDGRLLLEDERGDLEVGPGQVVGDLGLIRGANLRCTAVEPTKVLVLSPRDVANIWTEAGAAFRAAALRSLRARWR